LLWLQFLIVGVTVGAVVVTLYLGRQTQLETERLAIEQFNQQQLILARSAAASIEVYFRELTGELGSVAQLPEVQQMIPECLISMQHVYAGFPARSSIRRFDKNGILRFIYPFDGWRGELIGRDYSGEDFFRKVRATGRPSASTMIINEQGERRIRAAVPVYAGSKTETVKVGDMTGVILSSTDRREAERGSFEGVLVGSFDFSTIQGVISPIVSGNTGYAWLLDHKGIFVAHHDGDFIGQNAFEVRAHKNPDLSCETIDHIQRLMMSSEEGTGRYISGWYRGQKGEIEKLVAYAPVHINAETWSVAVCAPIDEVEQIVSRARLSEMLILGFVVLALLVGGLLLLVLSYRWSHHLEAQVARRTKELRETTGYLSNLIRHANAPIIVWDSKKRVTIFNRAFEEMSGRTEAEMMGQPLDILFPEESRSACLERIEAASAGEFWQTVEIAILHKDGEIRVGLWDSASIYGEDGKELVATVGQGQDITDRKRAEEKIEHLNLVLRAIRNVNQLITQEKDRDRLIEGACENLTENRGYHHAWIALLDESGALLSAAESRLGEDFRLMLKLLKRGELPHCARSALEESAVVVVENVHSKCKGCPLSSRNANGSAFVVRLGYRGKVYGLLSVSIRTALASDEEERSLFAEVANDIGFALHDIELEEQRKRAEEALEESEERLQLALSGADLTTWDWDVQTGELGAGRRWPSSLGYSQGEIERHARSWEELVHPEDVAGRAETLRAHLAGETAFYKAEYRVRAKSGEYRWIASRGKVVSRAENGEPIRMAGTNLDITEGKRAEEALRESERKHRVLIETSHEVVFCKDRQGRYHTMNLNAAIGLGGKCIEDVEGKTDYDLLPKEQADALRQTDKQVMEAGEEVEVEEVVRNVEGENRIYLSKKWPLYDDSGRIDGIGCFAMDVTERRRAEEALEDSEARYRSLTDDVLDSSGVGVFILDAEFRVVWINQALERFFALGRDELIGKDKRRLIGDRTRSIFDDPDSFAEKVLATYDDNTYVERFECRVLPGDGREERWLEHWSQPIRSGLYAGGRIEHYYDITERKRAEEAMRESEERFRNLMEHTPGVSIQGYRTDGTVVYWNKASEEVYGYTADEAVGKNLGDLIVPQDLKPLFEQCLEVGKELKNSGQFLPPGELMLLHKKGHLVPVYSIHTAVCIEGKEPLLFCIDVDLSERKKAEELLRKERDFAQALINTAQAIVLTLDREGRILSFNPYLEQLSGHIAENIKGQDWFTMFLPERDQSSVREFFLEALSADRTTDSINPIVTMDGRERVIEWHNSTLKDAQGEVTGLLAIGLDITERRQLEERLLQAEKMEAIGRLAGGIAHDFNNILSAVIGNLDLLRMDVPEGESVPAEIEEIGAAATRAADLTEQLLAFSRKQIIAPKVINLNRVIRDLRRMLKRLIRENVEIETLLERGLPSIKMDSTQLQQVILNLALNARDAMPHGGKLTIETKGGLLDEEYRKSHPSVAAGPYVMLTVSDTVHGMNAETLSHVFEPFYTTKEMGRGTGLGLSTVYGIVKQSGGHITVYSEERKGSCFRVYLPAIEEKAIRTRRAEAEPESLASRGETILVVEDDEAVKGLVERILTKAGYKVESAPGPAEAIGICEAPGKTIDLLLTDVVMPDMQGRDLAEILGRRRPNLRALFMSGYSENVIAHLGVLDEGIEFIGKPFSSEDLLRRIRTLLDR